MSCVYIITRLSLLKSLPTDSITDVDDIVYLVCQKSIFIKENEILENVSKNEALDDSFKYCNLNCFFLD